jgi:cob(I)alamin adenosyltransferase
LDTGMIHLYIGDGKGKTTAALGLLVRAHGAGLSCLFVQFLKGTPTSELAALDQLKIPYIRTDDVKKFVPFMDAEELGACRKSHRDCFNKLTDLMERHPFDCVVLDEILDAVSLGMIQQEELLAFLEREKGRTEIVLTGRNPGEKILELADYVTEMKKMKHPYEKGVAARKGVEY